MRGRQVAPRQIEVLMPMADRFVRPPNQPLAGRLDTLAGTTIGFVDNTFTAIRLLHDEIARALAPLGIERIDVHKKYWRLLAPDQIEILATQSHGVIGSLGNTSPSAVASTRDAISLELRGRPTVTFITAYFEDLLTRTAAADGMPELKRIVLPSEVETMPDLAVTALGAAAAQHVVLALTSLSSPTVVRL